MLFVMVMLFNAVREPLIIILTIPLGVIGVVLGLLVTGFPFGFIALLGILSLGGMMIKNVIVLLDEIRANRAGGRDLGRAARRHHHDDGVRADPLRDDVQGARGWRRRGASRGARDHARLTGRAGPLEGRGARVSSGRPNSGKAIRAR